MTQLTTNQLGLLRAAAGADDGAVLASDDAKTVRALIKKGLLIALPQADGPSRLLITEAGREAIAVSETEPATTETGPAPEDKAAYTLPPAERTPAPKGKLGILVTLLRAPTGATVEAMAAATGWQHHSVRGAMSGALKKKLGLAIDSQKTEAGRIYRIAEGDAA